jgi:hypothetical protein
MHNNSLAGVALRASHATENLGNIVSAHDTNPKHHFSVFHHALDSRLDVAESCQRVKSLIYGRDAG